MRAKAIDIFDIPLTGVLPYQPALSGEVRRAPAQFHAADQHADFLKDRKQVLDWR